MIDRQKTNLTRRGFLTTSAAAGLAACVLPARAAETGGLPGGLFESPDPAVLKLADEIYQKCILGKIFPAQDPMLHNWIGPGGGYRGQWIWDTMFVVDLLSLLPGKEQVIRDVFQNYWDFQVRWNKEMPDYAHDMVPCMIIPDNKDWVKFPAYSQIAILAWGVERVYLRNHDKQLAADIADKTVANAIQNGISERYDSVSGKKLGVEYLGMTCTVITMMLDGLCKKHQLKIKTTP